MIHNPARSFPVGISDDLGAYVYLYRDPRSNGVFYIGKGSGDRAFAHLAEADQISNASDKVARIREIWVAGHDVEIVIQRFGMTDSEAYQVEAALIEIFPDAENEVEGKGTLVQGARLVEDLINEKTRTPAQIDFPAVIINIRKEWLRIRESRSAAVAQDKLYLSTRTAWAVQPKRHPRVEYAISAAFGLIRQVYKIKSWRPANINADGTSRPLDDRWMFDGEVAADKADLTGQAIDHLQKPGARNAIRWWYPEGNPKRSPLVEVHVDAIA